MSKRFRSYLGTSPETISRKLKNLKTQVILKISNKKIKILDLDGLLLI